MKYIRTSDKLLENKLNMNFRDLKQSDSIEELCDEFVVEYTDGSHVYYPIVAKVVVLQEMSRKKDIYGAIWTKGEHGEPILKSVAKMNEKGKLRLL